MDINNFLKIEEDIALLKYKVTPYYIPLWLLVRTEIGIFYLPSKLLQQEPTVKHSLFALNTKDKLKYLALTLANNCFRATQSDIVIFGEGINNVLDDKQYINRLYDPFWFALQDKILLLERSDRYQYPTPRFNRKVLYTDIIPMMSRMLSKFTSIPSEEIITIRDFIQELSCKIETLFGIKFLEHRYLERNLVRLLRKMKVRIRLYQKLLLLTRPKLIIIEDGHYGGYTDLICIAKKLGVKVAEYQHGFIGPNHFAYNYHPVTHTAIKSFLPDYMLFWGDYWSYLANVPAQKIVIGFPYLDEKSKESKKKDNTILLISSGMMPKDVIDFGLQLIKMPELQKYKFIFRPHPSERKLAMQRYESLLQSGYNLDIGNLYETLKRVDACISLEPSTVLYEAMSFNCKTFLKENRISSAFRPDVYPFEIFDQPSEIVKLLNRNTLDSKERRAIFADNPIGRFQAFLEQHVYHNA